MVSKASSDAACEGQVIEAAPTEHGCLAVGLVIALNLEHVELRPVPDLDDRQPRPLSLGELAAVAQDLGVEDVAVEAVQAVRIIGDDRHVVQTLEQHALPPWLVRCTHCRKAACGARSTATSHPGNGPRRRYCEGVPMVRRQRCLALLRAGRGTGERLLCISGTGGDLRQQPRLTDGPLADALRGPGLRPARPRAEQRARRGPTPWPTSPTTPPRSSTPSAGTTASSSGVSFGGMVAQELAHPAPRAGAPARPGLHLGRWCGRRLLPAARAGRPRAPRSGRRCAWSSSTPAGTRPGAQANPDMVRADRRAHAPRGRRRGSPRPGPDQPAGGPGRARHRRPPGRHRAARPSCAAGASTGSPRRPTASSWPRAIPGARLELFDGGHGFFLQDATAHARHHRLPRRRRTGAADAP